MFGARATHISKRRAAAISSRIKLARPIKLGQYPYGSRLPLTGRHCYAYPVLYMHDGQNLFDRETAFLGEHWGVGEIAEALVVERRIRPFIAVGIWHSEHRGREYLPKTAEHAPRLAEGEPAMVIGFAKNAAADLYLRFCIEELKPFVDSTYRTLPEAPDCLVMGSSRGALISLYGVCEYPAVFGGAGCLSIHWPAAGGATLGYFESALPPPSAHRFYFDYGSETLDVHYGPYQKRMDEIMIAAGYRHGEDWVTRYYPHAEHSEHRARYLYDGSTRCRYTLDRNWIRALPRVETVREPSSCRPR